MADETRWEAERARWVQARAGRLAGASRRAERLAARARRLDRYEAGAGDSAASEVFTRTRLGRGVFERDEHAILGAIGAVVYEGGRIVVAGPGIGLSWCIYGLWWKNVTSWGPLRWERLMFAAMALTGVVIGAWWIIAPDTAASRFWLFYCMAQMVIGVGRASWLAWAYGWSAAPTTVRAGGVAPIRVMTGTEPPLPTTEPSEPTAPAVPIKTVWIPAPYTKNDEEN